MGRKALPTICHPEREHAARGLCDNCYGKFKYEKNKARYVELRAQKAEAYNAKRRERYNNDKEWRDRVRAMNLKSIQKNPDRYRERTRISRQKNRDKVRKGEKEWIAKNPEKAKKIQRDYQRRRRNTVMGSIHGKISRAISAHLKEIGQSKNNRTWPEMLGFNASQLRIHLEASFLPGMTWDGFLRGEIHIDHEIPKSKFKFSSVNDIEFKRCWALENLQPLWASDNYRKKDKILRPAQIALGI